MSNWPYDSYTDLVCHLDIFFIQCSIDSDESENTAECSDDGRKEMFPRQVWIILEKGSSEKYNQGICYKQIAVFVPNMI